MERRLLALDRDYKQAKQSASGALQGGCGWVHWIQVAGEVLGRAQDWVRVGKEQQAGGGQTAGATGEEEGVVRDVGVRRCKR